MSSNDQIETVRLELIRPGPTHGQLLSPLTPYLALCGDESPVTLQIDFEHWRLLNRLERLRYATRDNRRGMVAQPDSARESELEELGRDVGEIFAAIPTLGRELGRAAGRRLGLVHLRLLISGSELSLLPFEILISPTGFPGLGRPLFLQPETPIVITREVRRGQQETPVNWNRKPRILFVSAAPAGMHVPAREHVHALRRVIEPWVKWADDPRQRLAEVNKHITVLINASLRQIRIECARATYSHVHILAHGGSYEESGQTRYGLILCDEGEPTNAHIVDGQSLAEALHVKLKCSTDTSRPSIVSLATCDAGNPGSIVAPGGSIAHDLHAYGVPWVFASQFPLTKRGSVFMTEKLYHGLLWGEDPRALLAHLRLALHVERRHDHDWGSLVAYAATPGSLLDEVAAFRSHQFQAAIDNDRARADHYQCALENVHSNDAQRQAYEGAFRDALEAARERIRCWKSQLSHGDDEHTRRARVECFAVEGATEKKLAESFHKADMKREENQALQASLAAYLDALHVQPDSHWPATQYLALTAILQRERDPDRWAGVRGIAMGQVESTQGIDKAWAHGTLAEIELLRIYHLTDVVAADVTGAVVKHCKQIVTTVGWDHFAAYSTKRQFQRYVDWWRNDEWCPVAKAAIAALTRGSPGK